MTTYMAGVDKIKRNWYVIDAKDKTLGRLATELARRLRGKHKAIFTPHIDTGDFIIVINAREVQVTGRKLNDKIYYHHSGYPGGIKSESFNQLRDKAPERLIELAVKGMLPKGPLGRAMFRKLKVYADGNHPHHAQQPQLIEI